MHRLGPLAFLGAVIVAVATAMEPAARAAAPRQPKVVAELFTSQGCSSCPPADAYLRDLAGRPDVLALSMHIDYWNNLGWPDPYSSPETTARQRAYVGTLGTSYVYTPQMVIDGRSQAVGSRRGIVARLISDAEAQAHGGPTVVLKPDGADKVRVSIGAAPSRDPATVWLVAFDDNHTTRIGTGENSGRTLSYVNVVRRIAAVGAWSGTAKDIVVDVSSDLGQGYGNWAVLVQAREYGRILGAAALPRSAMDR